MTILKYIGPFLRMNSLNQSKVNNQLFYFAKESLKQVVLYSKCGITLKGSSIEKTLPNNDINIVKNISPLLCIYKKADSKISLKNKNFTFSSHSLKKEVEIRSNGYMILSILNLYKYYKNFTTNYSKEYCSLFKGIVKSQLDFCVSHLRNTQGFFVDKKDLSDNILSEVKFLDKSQKISFCDQALMMNCFYLYSLIDDTESSDAYKTFSLDILNAFILNRDNLYSMNNDEYVEFLFQLCIFYESSKNVEAMSLILDLEDYYTENTCGSHKTSFTTELLMSLCNKLMYDLFNIDKFREKEEIIKETLIRYFDDETYLIFRDDSEDKVYSEDIILYIINLLERDIEDSSDIISKVYKTALCDNGLILSFIDAPEMDNEERYRNQTLKSEDLLEENNFSPSHDSSYITKGYAPIFLKRLELNRKKNKIKLSKNNFYSSRNMFIFYLILRYMTPILDHND